ncbi:hypothetical protein SCHPADRAFT_884975 [Schizopora paradoxa]|uniref:Uncharacterized protein n=1 Tax=Schizopora paradoxa TaxID=27342 RepID=A0A0H2SSY7_9AGAM|nr:hypothetical protein SCHPADRAFT_884975 [Schizopora paradoxa]
MPNSIRVVRHANHWHRHIPRGRASVDEEDANQGTKGTFIGAVRTSSPALSSSATLDGVNLPTALVAAAPTSSLRYFRTTLPSRIASPEMSDIYCNWNGAIIPTIDPKPTIPGKRFIRRNFKFNPKLFFHTVERRRVGESLHQPEKSGQRNTKKVCNESGARRLEGQHASEWNRACSPGSNGSLPNATVVRTSNALTRFDPGHEIAGSCAAEARRGILDRGEFTTRTLMCYTSNRRSRRTG